MFNRLQSFFAGRYGLDQLSVAIFILAVIAGMVSNFVVPLPLTIVSFLLYCLTVFRMFSRNFNARRNENARFMRIWNRVRSFFSRLRTRIRDSKTHRFFKCPGCHNTLRVPKKRGKLLITCPKCGERFEKKT